VIAGAAKGRPLTAPAGQQTRPTTDRVREAIFSTLTAEAMRGDTEDDAHWPFERVLDLYAGSGAMGIEALSRGSVSAHFVETNPRARATILLNLQRTGFARIGVIHALPAEAAIGTLDGPFDLVLADPPYHHVDLSGLLAQIGSSRFLAPNALVVVEYARGFEPPAAAGMLRLLRVRRYGTTEVAFYAAEAAPVVHSPPSPDEAESSSPPTRKARTRRAPAA
jgi:16S rRNA (guanine966-N2)-methyltransferase